MIDNPRIHEAHTQVKDIIDALVIRDGSLTLVSTHNGDIPIEENHGYGLYYRDCRFLSGYLIKINGNPPTNILSSDDKGYASIHMLTNQRFFDVLNFASTAGVRKQRHYEVYESPVPVASYASTMPGYRALPNDGSGARTE